MKAPTLVEESAVIDGAGTFQAIELTREGEPMIRCIEPPKGGQLVSLLTAAAGGAR